MATFEDRLAPTPFERRQLAMTQLARNWWAVALRGLVNILFGVALILAPGLTTQVLILAFAAYAIVDGVLEIASAVRAASRHERWGSLALSGLVSLAAGIGAFFLPGTAIFAFLALIAAWAILSGVLMLVAAFRMDATDGRWWMGLAGLVSLAFGVFAAIVPYYAFVVIASWIAGFSIAFGAFLLILGFRLRSRGSVIRLEQTPAAPLRSR